MSNGHPYQDADYDLYALGALKGEENAAIESHTASCQECAHKLAEARGRVAMLALSVDPVEPAPGVKESLMRQLMASAEGHETWQRAPEPRRVHATSWWTAVWAPAALALACVTIFLWVQNRDIDRQLATQQAELARLQAQVEETKSIGEFYTAKDTVRVPLNPSREARGATATVLYNARLGKILYNDTLSSPPTDKSYQLWLVPADGNPISAGVMPTGMNVHILTTVPAGTQAKAFAVTIEPTGGSPQPTGPKVLVGGV